jgi:cysteine-rich repeat protein
MIAGMRALCLMVVLAGCVQTGAVVCPDQRVCPESYTCSAFGCLSPEQFKACDGVADGETCQVQSGTGRCSEGACVVAICGNGVVEPSEACDDGNQFSGDACNGTCSSDESCGNGLVELEEQCDCGAATASDQASCEGTVNGGGKCTLTCHVVRCGNGEMDPGEVCDDGNAIGGDGCSYDCTSLEDCGNGILDFFAGEQCDDGNLRGIDGCSPSCRVESAAWRPLDVATPPIVTSPAVAYDTARNVLVAFGGNSSAAGGMQAVTWELRGTTWTRVPVVLHPSSREGPAMAYDAKRRKMILFGGIGTSTVFADTWEFDGATWTQLFPANSPSGRFNHRLAYDSARGRVVLFAGQTTYGGTRVNDTWEWDGVNWLPITPTTTPPAVRAHHGLTYDPVRNRVVLFGGVGAGNVSLGDTWEYNGTTWTERMVTGPTARSGASLTFDVLRGKIVMTGQTETWTLDSAGWTQISTATQDRIFHAAAYDTERGKVVIFGGIVNSTGVQTNLVAELGSTAWATPAIASPAAVAGHAMAFDTRRGVAVMFNGSIPQTWELAGTSWRLVPVAASPTTSRTSFSMAYDALRGKVVLFGGSATSNGNRLADTWEYDGATWTQASPTASPTARAGSAMVYDSARQHVVLYGGFAGTVQNDLWEYDGLTWTVIPATAKPTAGQIATLAYDSARQRLVTTGNSQSETWIFDAAGWRKLPAGGPRAINGGALVYDAGRDRVIQHGGLNDFPLDETWELDGDTWKRFVPFTAGDLGPARDQHEMVYDPTLRRTILFGGSAITTPYTWFFASIPVQAVEACTLSVDLDGDTLKGCADDDCWGYCSPHCVPGAPAASCSMVPHCGDGTCNLVENCRSCPADCAFDSGTCPTLCGDGYCDPGETTASCPGDCL